MRLPTGIRPPHRLLLLFLAATVVPSVTLVWLGWKVVQQDRKLEGQRLQERLESAATSVSVRIERELLSFEHQMVSMLSGSLDSATPAGTIGVRLSPDGTVVRARPSLVFEPHHQSAPEPPDSLWIDAERLEFALEDPSGAALAYRKLAMSANVSVRAGAFVRLARVLKRLGRNQDALEAYANATATANGTVNGDPAGLIAGVARVELLTRLDQRDSARREVNAIVADLRLGRWSLDRTTFLAYAQAVTRYDDVWRDDDFAARAALADAVLAGWTEWQNRRPGSGPGGGLRSLRVLNRNVLLGWREESSGLLMFAATSDYLAGAWKDLWPRGLAVAVVDDQGRTVAGGIPDGAGRTVDRPGAKTRLPWTVRVAATTISSEIAGENTARRRVLIAGLTLIAFLILATGYLVNRTVRRELAAARQQADFVSAVSHEFRSPLTTLTHLTALLRSDFQPGEARRRQYYDTLARETDRLRRFVETLLDFGRMRAGATRYRLEPVDLPGLVAGVVEEFKRDDAAGAHPVSLVTPATPVWVQGDRDALTRALWNLLDNAAKYSPDGNPIVVAVETGGTHVVLTVTDKGIGIPADEQSQVFRQFFRGQAASSSAIRGTGVGLAVVQDIVRAHAADLSLQSQPGSGSTFSIRLPIGAAGATGPSRRAS